MTVRQDAFDVAYSKMESPLGDLLVATTQRGLARIAFPHEPQHDVLDELADRLPAKIVESSERTDRVRRELTEYFDGHRRKFDLELDLSLSQGFRREVLKAAVGSVPFGKIATYTDVAAAAGRPAAVRAAASALANNPVPIVVPCHRVVRKGGGLGGYSGGLNLKVQLLELEGIYPGGEDLR